MYVNRADLGQPHADIVNTELPLLITAVGQYRLNTVEEMRTHRPMGRGDYQLVYIAAGCGYFALEGQIHTFSQGTAVLFRPGVPQDYTFRSSDKAEYFWCHFTGSEVEKLLSDCRIAENRMVFSAGTSSDFQWLFLQMVRELQAKRQGYEEILRLNLRHLCLLIGRHRTEEHTADAKILGEIESAVRFFNACYYHNFDIKEYAKQHWMTPHWFAQNFKQATGVSPKQYIIALRMANAKHLLDNTSDTIAQIAAAVGYENTPYFHRLFHKQTGMTPLEYRHRPRQ